MGLRRSVVGRVLLWRSRVVRHASQAAWQLTLGPVSGCDIGAASMATRRTLRERTQVDYAYKADAPVKEPAWLKVSARARTLWRA